MLIEETISDSFNLDFDILKNNALTETMKNLTPKLKSDDIFKEFENFSKETKEIFSSFLKLFETCNEQRKHFRIALIKLLKGKSLLDQLIIEDNNQIVSQKLKIHDELKARVLDNFNRKIFVLDSKNNKLINENRCLKEEIKKLHNSAKCILPPTNQKKQVHFSKTEIKIKNQSTPKNKISVQSKKTETYNKIIDNSTVESTLSLENNYYPNRPHTRMDKLEITLTNIPDFSHENFGKISSSPIDTPKNFKSKVNLLDENKNIDIKLNEISYSEESKNEKIEEISRNGLLDRKTFNFQTLDPNNISFEGLLEEDMNEEKSVQKIAKKEIDKTEGVKAKGRYDSFNKDNYNKCRTSKNFENIKKGINYTELKKKQSTNEESNLKLDKKRLSFNVPTNLKKKNYKK